MKKPLCLVKDLGGLYRVRDRDGEPLTVPLSLEDAKEILTALNTETPRAELVTALEKFKLVFEEMFAHCYSNGVFNAWGKPFDCSSLNELNYSVGRLLKAEGIFEHQWLHKYGASLPYPLSSLTLSKSWVYVRGRGVFDVMPSHHNIFLSGLFAAREWESLGYMSSREAEYAVSVDTGRASDLFIQTTPGVFLKSSVPGSALLISPGELTQEEKDFLDKYMRVGLVENERAEGETYTSRLRSKFVKKGA